MRPLLQLALDVTDLDRALALARAAAPHVEILEAGTPLIKAVGMEAVRALRAAFPEHQVLADLKTMDAGAVETALAAEAGASLCTVLGAAPDATVQAALGEARRRGIALVADLLGVAEPEERARTLARLGVNYVQLHLGIDQQRSGDHPMGTLGSPDTWQGLPLCVAGGLTAKWVRMLIRGGYPARILVVGAAITAAADPGAAARTIRRACAEDR